MPPTNRAKITAAMSASFSASRRMRRAKKSTTTKITTMRSEAENVVNIERYVLLLTSNF